MEKISNPDGATIATAGAVPDVNNPIRKLMLPLMDPAEMTPEERMEELASILAMAFLEYKIAAHSCRADVT